MAFCTHCGEHTQDGAKYCSGCGHALGQPEKGRPLGMIILAAATALALVIALCAWWFTRPDTEQAAPPPVASSSTSTSRSSTASPTPSTTSNATTSRTTTSSPTPTPSLDAESRDALAQLNRLRSDSLGGLSLDGRWVLQMSSKADGTVDPMQRARNGSHTFHLPDILADHQQMVSSLPETPVLLLKASDFGKQNLSDGQRWWVTIVDTSATSREDALNACRNIFGWDGLTEEQLKNRCLPRRLTPPS